MATVMAILGIMNSLKAMYAGDKLGGALGVLGSVNQSGWFNSTPSFEYHSFGETDAGAKRNFM